MTTLAPGLALVGAGLLAAVALNAVVSSLSRLVIAVVIGAIIGNAGLVTPRAQPGVKFAAKRLMRVGVVLLGFRLSIGQITDLGPATLSVVVITVVTTFFGAQALGRRLGLSPGFSLLVGTGFGICGLSAIAAVEGATDTSEDEVATAMGLVTLFGTLAIFTVPFAGNLMGLTDVELGTWIGASVHDTAQVVAAASTGTGVVLTTAIAVKLTRILLLAPIVAGVNVARSRALAKSGLDNGAKKPPLIPIFVVGFIVAVLIRTSGVVPDAGLDAAKTIEGLMLAAAMVGLGAGVDLARIRQLGPLPLVLGFVSWIGIAALSLAAVLVAT
ncbi:MAG: YeiH family protein [Ilumatobacter sp.]